MKPVCHASLIRSIDQNTIHEIGLPSLVLMENAGRGIANDLIDQHGPSATATIFCGKGNNGGDGLVIGRVLADQGWSVRLVILTAIETLSPDARHQFDLLSKIIELDEDYPVVVQVVTDSALIWDLPPTDLIIDAILGTGSEPRELPPLLSSAVEYMNHSESFVVAVDCPTGLNADNGQLVNNAVEADITYPLGAYKQGLFLNDGPNYTGDLKLIEIGLPFRYLIESKVFLNELEDVAEYFPERLATAHKYEAGSVLLIGGSVGMHGAIVLTADAANATGAGITTVFTDQAAYQPVAAHITDSLVYPVDYDTLLDHEIFKQRLEKADCLAIGPGLGQNEATQNMVLGLISKTTLPVILDADGLALFRGHLDLLSNSKAPLILTPHLGEFCSVFGFQKEEVLHDPIGTVQKFCLEFGHILVLKGPHTLIGFPDGRVIINPTGNEGLATAGSGDVLTGIIASLVAQGMYIEDAAADGVFMHGLTADMALEEHPAHHLTASLLISYIGSSISHILNATS